MICNIGRIERSIRIVLGLVLLAVGALAGLSTGWMVSAYVVGAIALLTGAIRFCPAWMLLGINTCPTKESTKC